MYLDTDWFCAVSTWWRRLGPEGCGEHDVHHHVLLLASGLLHADRSSALQCHQLVDKPAVHSCLLAKTSRSKVNSKFDQMIK